MVKYFDRVFFFLNCVYSKEHEEVMLIISDYYRLLLISITTYRRLGKAKKQSGHKCAQI